MRGPGTTLLDACLIEDFVAPEKAALGSNFQCASMPVCIKVRDKLIVTMAVAIYISALEGLPPTMLCWAMILLA